MKKLSILIATFVVGIGSAITYHIFENAVHGAINAIWYDAFDTDEKRLMVVPLALGFSVVFFGLQHYLDRKSERKEEHGLGEMPEPTVANYLKILLIGFFSLLAGATLGPEAILVPACMLVGAFVAQKLLKADKQVTTLLAAAGLMALFTAFFDSFYIGVLSLFLVLSKSKAKFQPVLLVIAIVASAGSKLTLNLLEGEAFAPLPKGSMGINIETIFLGTLMVGVGFVIVETMSKLHDELDKIRASLNKKSWLLHALVAGFVLSGLFLIGGPLVEFTGNKSIIPMFSDAAELGFMGLLWILVVKIFAISWSKAIGYRGGMIFPTIFLAAVLVAMVQLAVPSFGTTYGIVAVIIGALISNRSNHVLV